MMKTIERADCWSKPMDRGVVLVVQREREEWAKKMTARTVSHTRSRIGSGSTALQACRSLPAGVRKDGVPRHLIQQLKSGIIRMSSGATGTARLPFPDARQV
jgi:hypothetical protein